MIEILDDGSKDVFAMRVSGKLLHRDYQQFIPMLEKLIEERGSLRCLIEMTDFQGVEFRALWDEIKFEVRHALQIERCAVVGDRSWWGRPRSGTSTRPSWIKPASGSRRRE